jgi:leucyl aminopeptidase (aminopeptidase T)
LWGEYNWAPIENSANGVLVIDGLTEASDAMRVASEPVKMNVAEGRVVEVAGRDADAQAFRSIFATDAGAATVGELGIGGNPRAHLGTESEKALLGTVHIGFGNNTVYPGGVNESAIHVDGVVRRATLEVDGRTIIASGQLVD